MSDKIRVLLADAHTLTQLGATTLIDDRDKIELIDTAETLEEAQRLCGIHQPDVLMLGMSLPDQNLAQTIAFVKESCPNTHVMMLTAEDDEVAVQALVSAGVKGYIFKDKSKQEIVEAIHLTARGKRNFGEDALQAFVAAQQTDVAATLLSKLTSREHDVLKRIARGDNNSEIATKLSISLSTVASHINHINDV